jgi:hypothetical protein
MFGYIYITKDLKNNKIYIGQKRSSVFLGLEYIGSGAIISKIKKHCKKHNIPLENRFSINMLCECRSQEEMDNKEKQYISDYKAQNKEIGYNIVAGGEGSKDLIHSEKTREYIRKCSKNLWENKNHKEKMSFIKLGDKNPSKKPGVGDKISKAKIGHYVSDETKQKISIKNTGRIQSQSEINSRKKSMLGKNSGKNNGMFGKKPWNIGMKMSRKHKNKLSLAKLGRAWVTDGINNKLITQKELSVYFENGYRKGRIINTLKGENI